jgi:hypothetical protein
MKERDEAERNYIDYRKGRSQRIAWRGRKRKGWMLRHFLATMVSFCKWKGKRVLFDRVLWVKH